jgi:hypothetical protein
MRPFASIAVMVSIALPSAAQAGFSAPAEVAQASGSHRGFVAAADANGRLTVATRTPRPGFPYRPGPPWLLERPAGGGWADLPPVPGIAFGVFATSIAAAGNGALGVAWSVLAGSSSIHVAVRDPGGTLSAPIEIAGAAAAGVDHPAIAVDATGDVLLAYQTATTASHLRLQGAIAVAYRRAGSSSFIGPIVVDRAASNPPVVALARDGAGIVTWTRKQTLMAATVGSDGAIGAAKRLARSVLGERPVVAAGPRSAASVAYRVNETAVHGKRVSVRYSVRVLARPAGGSFGRARAVFRGSNLGRGLALAADEQGRATLAWTGVALSGGGTGPRVWSSAGRVGSPLGRPRLVAPRDDSGDEALSIAARNGRVALAWPVATPGRPSGVQVAIGRWNEALEPQLIRSDPPAGPAAVTVAGDGRTSAVWRAGKLWVSDGP